MRFLRITFSVLAVFVAIGVILYFVLDASYSSAVVHADTAIGPDPKQPDSMIFLEKPGRTILVLERGEGESRLGFTDSSWRETIAIEFEGISHGDRIDLAGPNVRVGYRKFQPFGGGWGIGEGGVRGYIQFRPTSSGGHSVSYDIRIDTFKASMLSGHQHREVEFSGRSKVIHKSRPNDIPSLSVWPSDTKKH